MNQCAYQSKQDFFLRANGVNGGSGTVLPAAWPPFTSGEVFDQHMSWPNDNSSDTTPFCTSAYGWDGSPVFAPTHAWQDEILCVATNGGGQVWRFAHTFATNQAQFFTAEYAIGALSQDGHWFAWATDHDGMLGNTNLSSASCTIGSDCRADVEMMYLPHGAIAVPAKPAIIAAREIASASLILEPKRRFRLR